MIPGVDSDPAELFRVDGRVAVVTGASSGLGAAVARALALAGASVALVGRRLELLESVAAEIGGLPVGCDLLDRDALDRTVAQVAADLGPPQILVNVAGALAGVNPGETEPAEAIDRTLALNLVAPFRLSQLVYPHMRAAGKGAIVNISSISGLVGIPGIPQGSYAASKAGLSGLTAELAVQWGRHSIRVNTIAAGFFRSDMTRAMYEDERTARWLRRNTLLPYDGRVDDFVGAVLWLVSDAGRYVTGQTITVDGGWTAR
jgi:NAD(P)-dependent dehydrogenase (short-subunit alcohol dehydrogenase family)